jgi:transcriptional regulator with PAS, ATPase and Fis domain
LGPLWGEIRRSNRDLRQLMTEGRFQEDLYYRLNVIPLAIPPLRDRREDIPALVDYFIKRHAERAGKRVAGIAPEALVLLTEAPWPGNVRELENTLERAVVLSSQPVIQALDVVMVGAIAPSQPSLPSLNLKQNLEWTERETVRRALESARGVKKDAAESMGISQRALSYYLAKHKLEDAET